MKNISDGLKKLDHKINQMRLLIGSYGFNKMQVDLFTQLETLENASQLRKSYGERVEDVYNYTQSDVFEPVRILGFDVGETGLTTLTILASPTINFVSILDVVKGNSNLKTRLNILSQKNQVFSEGVYVLSALYARGISYKTLEEWFEDPDSLDLTNEITKELFVRELELIDSVNLEDNILEVPLPGDLILDDNKVLFTYNENVYSVGYEHYIQVFEFLEESRWKARETYYKSPYNEDIQIIFGKEQLSFDIINYRLNSSRLGIDLDFQQIAFENMARIEGFDITQSERVFDFVSYGTSPLSVAILVTTGYYMGNIISPISGYLGSIISVAESIVIDAAVGAILVYGFDLKTEENIKTVMATTLGISAGLGVSKGIFRFNNITRKSRNISEKTLRSLNVDVKKTNDFLNNFSFGPKKNLYSAYRKLKKKGVNITYSQFQESYYSNFAKSSLSESKLEMKRIFDLTDYINEKTFTTRSEINRNLPLLTEGDSIKLKTGELYKIHSVKGRYLLVEQISSDFPLRNNKIYLSDLYNSIDSIEYISKTKLNTIRSSGPVGNVSPIDTAKDLDIHLQKLKRLIPNYHELNQDQIRALLYSTISLDDEILDLLYRDYVRIFVVAPDNPKLFSKNIPVEGGTFVEEYAGGIYYPISRKIYISNEQLNTNVFIHEIAHHLDFTYLSVFKKRQNFMKYHIPTLSDAYNVNNVGYSISDYSRTVLYEFTPELIASWYGYLNKGGFNQYVGVDLSRAALREINPQAYRLADCFLGSLDSSVTPKKVMRRLNAKGISSYVTPEYSYYLRQKEIKHFKYSIYFLSSSLFFLTGLYVNQNYDFFTKSECDAIIYEEYNSIFEHYGGN